MKIMSLGALAREIAYAHEGKRNLEGAIRDASLFVGNLAELQKRHRGAFAYMAFRPESDPGVAEYILGGSAGDDAGSAILVLFLSPDSANLAREVNARDMAFGMTLKREKHPAYRLAARFFPRGHLPRFPGIVFFDKLVGTDSSIYVCLDGASAAEVRTKIRTAFEAARASIGAAEANSSSRDMDFDRFAAKLFAANLAYFRAGDKGLRSAAFIFGAWVKVNGKSIVFAIPKLLGGFKLPAPGPGPGPP
jgi:hypothetical protein